MSYLNQNLTLPLNQFEITNQIMYGNNDILYKTEAMCISKLILNKIDTGHFCQYDQTNQSYKVGSYVLDRVIGKGNFSVVKSAIHIPTQMQVAVKVLHKSKMTKETLEKTYREVQIMKRLRHSNIVQLYQVIESTDWMFIIMEYVSFGELFDYLSQVGRLTENDARIKFRQMLDAVEYCHKMNIVHRDLKAENLLMDENFNIKLADFGFGSFYDQSVLLSTWCGSPPYAAPELFRGDPYNGPKSDIWSLGVVLYAMVCGTLPFDEPYNIVKLREQVLTGLVRFPYFLSYECELLIRMILNRNPEKRPSIVTIRGHKWMQQTSDEETVFVDDTTIKPRSSWAAPNESRSSRRCKTMCDDSGFDEPLDFVQSNTDRRSMSVTHHEYMDCDVNENVIQMMERCGFKRSSIVEELNQNTYGNLTATYLLLCEKLRIDRCTKSPTSIAKSQSSDNSNIRTRINPQTVFANKWIIDSAAAPRTYKLDPLDNLDSCVQRMHIDNKHSVDRASLYDNMNETYFKNQSNFCETSQRPGNVNKAWKVAQQLPGTNQIDIPNSNVPNRHVTSVVLDMVIPGRNEICGHQICYNTGHSSHGKPLECYAKDSHVIDNRRIHACSLTYSKDMKTIRPNVNMTAQPCILLHPRASIQYKQIHSIPLSNNNKLGHQILTNDPQRTYQQQSDTIGQVSSLYTMSRETQPELGFHAHSSPLKSDVVNDLAYVESQMTPPFDQTIPRVRCNQIMKHCDSLNPHNHKMDPDSVLNGDNNKKLPQHSNGTSYIDEGYYLPRCNGNDSHCPPNKPQVSSNDNRLIVEPSLSSGTKSVSCYTETCAPIIPKSNILQVKQLSPMNINFVRLS